MKRSGILNAQLSHLLATLGHTDTVVIADCGLPRPVGVEVVDLAVVPGVPTFEQVVAAISAELVVERAILAREAADRNPKVVSLVESRFGPAETVTHEELKRRSRDASFVVRTGEASPYANVILHCGVAF